MVWSMRCAVILLSVCVLYTSGRLLGLYQNDVCKRESGNQWICRKLPDCPKALEVIKSGKMPQPDICGYVGFEPVVCCEPGAEVTTRPSTTLRSSMKSISQRKCEEYADAVYVESTVSFFGNSEKENTCAAVAEPLIVNGKNTEPREYPHMALIGYGDRNSIQYLCGGSLISERYVLSAAHCTDAGRRGVARWARLGEYNINSQQDEEVQNSSPEVYEIVQRINHPEYRPPRLYNDIAIYKLNMNVNFNAFIRPCCLNYNPGKEYKQVIATGWGHTEWGGRGSDILQKVTLNVTDIAQCNISYQSSVGKQMPSGILPQSMLCAGDLANGGDTCQGDSGGPLQIHLESPYCMYSLLGITSFGKNCGSNNPGVYTRVSYFIPWIESIVWPS